MKNLLLIFEQKQIMSYAYVFNFPSNSRTLLPSCLQFPSTESFEPRHIKCRFASLFNPSQFFSCQICLIDISYNRYKYNPFSPSSLCITTSSIPHIVFFESYFTVTSEVVTDSIPYQNFSTFHSCMKSLHL